jgi:hypothetical protein
VISNSVEAPAADATGATRVALRGVRPLRVNELAALALVSGANFLSVFKQDQLDALAYLFLRLHGQGLVVAEIFWGLWLFPFGMLVVRSGFIPRALGFFLMAAGVGNLARSFASLLLPSYWHLVDPITMVLVWGELPVMFWLLIWGAKSQQPLETPASSSTRG